MTEPTLSDRDTAADRSTYAPPPQVERASLLDDFMDIFYAPSRVFARRANRSFWVPLLVVSVLIGLVFLANRDLFEPIMDAEFSRAMAKRGASMSTEQIEAARKMSGAVGSVFAFFTAPIAMLVVGLMLWIVGKFVDAKQTLNAAITVAVFSYVPRVVEGVVNRVQGLFIDPETLDHRFSLSLGVGRFLDPDTMSPVLVGILGRVDVFTIWVTILLAIGLAVTGKVSRGRAAIAGVAIWILGALPVLASTAGQ